MGKWYRVSGFEAVDMVRYKMRGYDRIDITAALLINIAGRG